MADGERADDGAEGADEGEGEGPDRPTPTAQSEALQRQQLFAGSAIAALAGVAVTVAVIQQYPGLSVYAAFFAGMVTAGLLFGLVFAGVFRDGPADSE
jgi:hypothetical protein